MYNNKLVAVIKQNGKVLNERGDKVSLPFGTDYSIHLKNLNSEDAIITIDIDGKDVLSGNSIVIKSGQYTDVTGALNENGNLPSLGSPKAYHLSVSGKALANFSETSSISFKTDLVMGSLSVPKSFIRLIMLFL